MTLDYLEELIKKPKGGGNAARYHYDRNVKNAIGAKPLDSSYWILLTNHILPNTRGMNYEDQYKELRNLRKRSSEFNKGGYRAPKALEVAVSVLMEHARSGTRFYRTSSTNGKVTYTSCRETTAHGHQVLIGGFVDSCLDVFVFSDVTDGNGLGAVRKVPTA